MPILKLEPNKPYILSLKYPTGKQVDGNWGTQLRWILGNGDLLYTPPIVGEQLEELGIKAGQSFTLTKIPNGHGFKWTVERKPQRAETPVRHETKNASP